MYLKKIQLKNIWPINDISINPNFYENWLPKPLILVWENGSGKTILLSYVVNFLLSFQQSCWFENVEVEAWKVYKYRSPDYISHWKEYSFAQIELNDWYWYSEIQLWNKKKVIEDPLKTELLAIPLFTEMWQDDSSLFKTTDKNKEECLESYRKNVLLYFPPNRFEDPAWLNEWNLKAKAEFQDKVRTSTNTDRKIIIYHNLKNIQNRFLDVIYDELLNRKINKKLVTVEGNQEFWDVLDSIQVTWWYNSIVDILKVIFNNKLTNPSFRIPNRQNRRLSLFEGEAQIIPNIFNLSSWETLLLDLALSIIRDFDLIWNQTNGLDNIQWVVVIDEIDLHLHSNLQKEVLPKLLKLFPKIQFIITTHSPLFLLGMEAEFWRDWFDLIDMPLWNKIETERFKEFQKAFTYYQNTQQFDIEIDKIVKSSSKPIILSEWKNYNYLLKAKEYFWGSLDIEIKKIDDLNSDQLESCFLSLSKTKLNQHKIFFIRDCDAKKHYDNVSKTEENLIPYVFTTNSKNTKISRGIENLFDNKFLPKKLVSEFCKKVNQKSEIHVWKPIKRNELLKAKFEEYMLANASIESFENFHPLFEKITEVLSPITTE